MIGMFSETGPCEVVEESRESITTVPRDFSWDRSSNMLFIDQVSINLLALHQSNIPSSSPTKSGSPTIHSSMAPSPSSTPTDDLYPTLLPRTTTLSTKTTALLASSSWNTFLMFANLLRSSMARFLLVMGASQRTPRRLQRWPHGISCRRGWQISRSTIRITQGSIFLRKAMGENMGVCLFHFCICQAEVDSGVHA